MPFFGQSGECEAVMRQHRLVCGDERLACLQRRAGERSAGPSDPPISSTTTSMSIAPASSIMSSTQSKREISTPRSGCGRAR
jgi:hypothetical protein